MAKIHSFQLLLAVAILAGCSRSEYEPHDGDIIFQTSRSSQSQAIQLATRSPYSHMGIVYVRNGRPFVFEAVQPVKLTPLDAWIARGEHGHFVAKRLRDADARLSIDSLRRMRAAGEPFLGKNYDLYFEWSDDRIYCSELVWKIFDRGAGVKLGRLQTLSEFDLAQPAVRSKLKERYGNHVPLQEIVISPAAIFEDPRLQTVYAN
ncbi:MAG TPA: YiiX family permuted papain-like enzyme [Steroidobacteraceae bacterium]|nr:YiiX family permuted papain-like enzyme [Steroidobacteraceae bacterium]